MTIHHATIKRAASLGIVLTETDDGLARAHHVERNRVITTRDPKIAVFLCQLAAKLAIEYPQVMVGEDQWAFEVNGETIWSLDSAELTDDEGEPLEPNDPAALEDAFAQIVDAIPEGTDPEEEDEPTGRVVVAQRYKDEYKARGDAAGCGDWLFQWLKRCNFRPIDGGKKAEVFDTLLFTDILVKNDVDFSGKWASLPDSGQRYWQGRYRMNGRQKLEMAVIAHRGVVYDEKGTAYQMPAEDFTDLLASKHKSLKEELETQAAEQQAA